MKLNIDTNPALIGLHRALDEACCLDLSSAEFALGVRSALAASTTHTHLLTAAQREGDAQTYRRHLLYADPLGRYAVAALVWQSGQASPVHGHHTWCAYSVIEGELSETLFAWNHQAHCAVQTRQHPRAPGTVSFVAAGRGAIHRLENASTASSPAISVHVYGVPGTQISTHVNDLVTAA
jgi:predicted metal-dependent enzyme (double-stranded beta helix superfamily)